MLYRNSVSNRLPGSRNEISVWAIKVDGCSTFRSTLETFILGMPFVLDADMVLRTWWSGPKVDESNPPRQKHSVPC